MKADWAYIEHAMDNSGNAKWNAAAKVHWFFLMTLKFPPAQHKIDLLTFNKRQDINFTKLSNH